MTREEVNWYTDSLKSAIKQNCLDEKYIEAIDALKTPPCEDAVSREAVISAITKFLFSHNKDADVLRQTIDSLPPVTPKQRTGKWIKDKNLYKCTACNDLCTVAGYASCVPEEQMYKAFKHCPNCGAKMEGESDAVID